MKHLQTFENFNEQDRKSYDNIFTNKEELENSTAFSEMSEKEQEVLSDAYSKESETISDEISETIKTLTKNSTIDELFGQSTKENKISDFESLYHDYWITYHNKVKEIEKILHSDIENSNIIDIIKQSLIKLKQEISEVEKQHKG